MAQLFLVDQSLNEEGGHHCSLAAMIVEACRGRGIACVVAGGRRFQPSGTALQNTDVECLFQYSVRDHLKAHAHLPGSGAPRGLMARWKYRSERRKRVTDFSGGLQELFQRHPLQPGDHVVLLTMRLFDTRTLLETLPRIPGAGAAVWHLLYHRSEIAPRGIDHPEYRDVVDRIRSWLAPARRLSGKYQIQCYATTAQLTQELRQLGLPHCREIPYPVSSDFRPHPVPRTNGGPLRILFAGAFRREKLDFSFQNLIDELWPDLLATGRARLVVQGAKQPINVLCGEEEILYGDSSDRRPVDDESENPDAPVVCLPHPLQEEEYLRQFQRSDIGMVVYDPDAYAKRISAVFGEFLAVGRPVIASAACWMGDDIHRITVQTLLNSAAGSHDLGVMHSANPEGVLMVDLPSPIQSGHDCLLSFDWECDSLSESHLEVTLRGVDLDGRPVSLAEVVGAVDEGTPIRLAVEAADLPFDRLELRARAIYPSCRLTGGRASFIERSSGVPRQARLAVGRAVGNLPGLTAAIRELVADYPAFREAAERFAPGWYAQHSADSFLDALLTISHEFDGT